MLFGARVKTPYFVRDYLTDADPHIEPLDEILGQLLGIALTAYLTSRR